MHMCMYIRVDVCRYACICVCIYAWMYVYICIYIYIYIYIYIIIIVIISDSTPVGVQCPISSSLAEFLSYWVWLWCPAWAFAFLSTSILDVIHSLLSAIGFQSCLYFTADVSPPIRSTLHLLTS